jgi:hypothetical protein
MVLILAIPSIVLMLSYFSNLLHQPGDIKTGLACFLNGLKIFQTN